MTSLLLALIRFGGFHALRLVAATWRPRKLVSSHFRGHPIVFTGCRWLYADTRESLPGYGGHPDPRPCANCGRQTPLGKGEVDPCLGVLPGVDNACCGHGVREQAYIRFESGVVVCWGRVASASDGRDRWAQ